MQGALEEVDWLRSKLERLEQALLGGLGQGAATAQLQPERGVLTVALGAEEPPKTLPEAEAAAVLEAARAAVASAEPAELRPGQPEAAGPGSVLTGLATDTAMETLAGRLATAVRSASVAAEAATLGMAPQCSVPEAPAAAPAAPAAASGINELMSPATGSGGAGAPLIETYLTASPSEMLQAAAALLAVDVGDESAAASVTHELSAVDEQVEDPALLLGMVAADGLVQRDDDNAAEAKEDQSGMQEPMAELLGMQESMSELVENESGAVPAVASATIPDAGATVTVTVMGSAAGTQKGEGAVIGATGGEAATDLYKNFSG